MRKGESDKMTNEKKADNEYTLKEYDCGYCKNVFRQYVRRVEAGIDAVFQKPYRHAVSSCVKCPRCSNLLKTWDEGKEIEKVKITGNAYNRYVKMPEVEV